MASNADRKDDFTQKSLRESETRLRTVIESMPFDFFVIDENGYYTMQNSTCVEHWGKVVGKRPADVAPDDKTLAVWQKNNRRAFAGEVVKGEAQFNVKGEDLYFYNIISPIYDGQTARSILGININITEQKRAEKELHEYQERLQTLASKLSLTEERQWRQVATELHENIGQLLAMIKIKLGSLQDNTSRDQEGDLQEIRELLDKTISFTRTLTLDLSPPVLYEFGLRAAFEWMIDRFRKEYGLKIDYHDKDKEFHLSDDLRGLLYRNLRELLVNIIKHAKANNVKVNIHRTKKRIEIEVKDDGCGFDPKQAKKKLYKADGFGLFSIQERLVNFGGNIKIQSKQRQGTRITLSVPLQIR
jgi:PAS domain S-box-containing protein